MSGLLTRARFVSIDAFPLRMLDPFADIESQVPPEPPKPRGHPLLAWGVILALVALIASWQWIQSRSRSDVHEDRAGAQQMKIEGRNLIGLSTLNPSESGADLYPQALRMNTGSVDRRLRFIVLAGELAGPEEALRQLDILNEKLAEHEIQPTKQQTRLLKYLDHLYNDYAQGIINAPSLNEEQREELRRGLDWFGELALLPPNGPDKEARQQLLQPARQTTLVAGGLVVLALFGTFIGLFLLLSFLGLLLARQIRGGLTCGQTPGGIYAETFALGMVLFVGLGLLTTLPPLHQMGLLPKGVAALLSLAILGWPVLRGIPWQQVRQDIGWTAGRRGVLEPFYGIACYLMALPLVIAGLLLMLKIMDWRKQASGAPAPIDDFSPSKMPSHPVINYFGQAGWLQWVPILFVVSVAAPIVEETLFRGVLYRHLREASCRIPTAWSVFLSATIVGFLFAVIHPQGLLGVPVLMMLAYGFTLSREWRGTLVPAMVAHGINNGVITIFSILVLRN